MDLFKFTSSLGASYFTEGEPINDYDKVTWIERYQKAGDFKLVAPLSSGLRDSLPVGSYISHINSSDVMCVENRQSEDDVTSEPIITISGRSISDVFLEDRIVGADENWGSHSGLRLDYTLTAAATRNQIQTLINAHLKSGVAETDNVIPNISTLVVAKDAAHAADESVARLLKRGKLSERCLDLMKIDDLGLKVVRRGWFNSGQATDWDSTVFYIHSGVDRADDVIFSWDAGDFDSAEYLFSRRNYKNAALVTGTYAETAIVPTETGEARRWLYVDASDVDGNMADVPTGSTTPTLTQVLSDLTKRGEEALKAQADVDASQFDLSSFSQNTYQVDYDLGDVVSVEGRYGSREKRRVIEYVQVLDENGTVGIPTFAAFDKDAP